MPEFIEKIRINVRVSRPGEPVMEGACSLSPNSPSHDGPETLLELVNSPLTMLPFQRGTDDAMLLLSRTDLQWVLAGPGVAPELVRPASYCFTREERVSVRMRTGEVIEGLLQMEMPENINRTSDFLNGPEPFFPLSTRQGIFLVQKACTREVRLFDSSPLPITGAAGF
jgi:hypothetical protein